MPLLRLVQRSGKERAEANRRVGNWPVLEAVVHGITRHSAELLSVAAEHLGVEDVLAATTVAQALHHPINLTLKYFSQLKAGHNHC